MITAKNDSCSYFNNIKHTDLKTLLRAILYQRRQQSNKEGQNESILKNSTNENLITNEHKNTSCSYAEMQNMVIHVFDEAKNMKKDFICKRQLLIKEMHYFKEHLSGEEDLSSVDVNISIHCDILIFEWLMNYICQRYGIETEALVKLDNTNVIPILVSSNFLKMPSLIEECIEYLLHNFSQVILGPSNLNCIDESIIKKISLKISPKALEAISDRKDKITGRLFLQKIEQLLSSDEICNKVFIFQCLHCQQHLTKDTMQLVCCLANRFNVSKYGDLSSMHVINPKFKICEFIMALKSQLKTWASVYWSLFGLITVSYCLHCRLKFRLCDLRGCCFHPEEETKKMGESLATYPCCSVKSMGFVTLNLPNRGCRSKDHIFDKILTTEGSQSDFDLETTLNHRNELCLFAQNPLTYNEYGSIDLHIGEDISISSFKPIFDFSFKDTNVMNINIIDDSMFGDGSGKESSDDDHNDNVDDDGEAAKNKKNLIKRKSSKKIEISSGKVTSKWDPIRSLRFNQDMQREEDQRRTKEMIKYLNKLRVDVEKIDKQKPREYNGGIFSRLETQWKLINNPPPKSGLSIRIRPRLNQLPITK